jgi:hypothetical protein
VLRDRDQRERVDAVLPRRGDEVVGEVACSRGERCAQALDVDLAEALPPVIEA